MGTAVVATLQPAASTPNVAIGVDWGATLAKLAVRTPEGGVEYRLLPTEDGDASRATLVVIRRGARRAHRTAAPRCWRAPCPAKLVQVNEFAAWGAGAAALLAQSKIVPVPRYLLVSVGTGTSILLVDGDVGDARRRHGARRRHAARARRGAARDEPTSTRSRALAQRGSRRSVDLLVSDIYPAGGIALAGDLTASNFGKYARLLRDGEPAERADVAHAIMGLIAENIALICTALAAATQVTRIVVRRLDAARESVRSPSCSAASCAPTAASRCSCPRRIRRCARRAADRARQR